MERFRRHRARTLREISRTGPDDDQLHRSAQMDHGTRRLFGRPEEIQRIEARSHPDGLDRRVSGKSIVRPSKTALQFPALAAFSLALLLGVAAYPQQHSRSKAGV